MPPAVEVRSPNYWTTRELPESLLKRKRKCACINFSNKKNLEEKITYKIIILTVKSLLIP